MKNIQNYIKTDVRHVTFLAITGQPTGGKENVVSFEFSLNTVNK